MIGFSSSRPWKSLAVILLVAYAIVFVSPPSVAFAQEPAPAADDCMQGKVQGKADAKGNALWLLGGFLCGIFGFGAALIAKPGVKADKIIGHSSEWVVCYTEAYQSSSRNKNVGYACLGWAISIPLILALQGDSDDD